MGKLAVKILLDTHTLLWWFNSDARLSAFACKTIESKANEVFVSAATAWEIATKARIGKLFGVQRLLLDFDSFVVSRGFMHLPVTHRHALLAGGFDSPHRDPFDRMLAAQASIEEATLLTNDSALSRFDVALAW